MDVHLQTLKRTAQAEGTAQAWATYAAALERREGVGEKDDGSYALVLNPAQMQTLVDATDMYSRVLVGQFGVVADPFMHRTQGVFADNDVATARQILDNAVKRMLTPGLPGNASLSIAGDETPHSAQISYDIHQVVRHRLAWNRTAQAKAKGEKDPFTGVWHYTPSKTGPEKLPRLLNSASCPCDDRWCPNSRKSETAET